MKSETKSLFWKLFLTLGAWTLVLTVVQGICLYYLVARHTANKLKVQTDFISSQTEKLVAEMKNFPSSDELKALEKNIEKIETGIGLKIETMERDILKDLIPALKITSQKPYYISGRQIKCIYSIKNKGKYSANINNVKLYLSTAKIDSPEKIKEQLILNKDFYLRTNVNTEDLAPGEEIRHDLTIELTNPENIPGTIYYCVTFDAQTDPSIVKSVKNIDQEKITSKKFYYILGDIVTPG
jgi:hypothetical protein|uniref:Uncharacterized protein n=1 Tax=Desulfobacca acetoxidans TaxID=60893 RepID=A0A7C3V3R6_9BACT